MHPGGADGDDGTDGRQRRCDAQQVQSIGPGEAHQRGDHANAEGHEHPHQHDLADKGDRERVVLTMPPPEPRRQPLHDLFSTQTTGASAGRGRKHGCGG